MQNFNITSLRLAAVLTGVIAVLIITLPTLAQQVMVRASSGSLSANSERPTMTYAEFQQYASVLELDDSQQMLGREFVTTYLDQFESAQQERKEKIEDMAEEATATGDFSIYSKEMPDLHQNWQRTAKRLEDELISNLKSMLNEDQVELWPTFERERRRAELLPDGRLGGESIDLIALLRSADLELDENTLAAIAPSIETYAEQIDLALQNRDREIKVLREEWYTAMVNDKDRARKLWDDATDARAVVRDFNQRSRDGFMNELVELDQSQAASKLEDLYNRQAYPLAFEQTKAEEALDKIATLEGLSADQQQQVAQVESDLAARLDEFSRRLMIEIRKEEQEFPEFLQHMQIDNGTEGGQIVTLNILTTGENESEERYDGLLHQRYDASKAAVARMKTILTPEQWQALPDATITSGETNFPMRFNLRMDL